MLASIETIYQTKGAHCMQGQIIRRGDRTWLLRVFLGRESSAGKRKYSNETFHGTKKKAQARLNEMLTELNAGTFIKPSKTTLGEFLSQWLEIRKPSLSERTHTDYTYLLEKYVRPTLGASLLMDVTGGDVQALYARMTSELGLGPRMVRYVHTVLSAALKKGVLLKQIRFNPAEHAELPKETRKEVQTFSLDQANKFRKAATVDRLGVVMVFALTTAMRPEEYFGLKWEDVDLKAGEVRVRRALIWRTRGGGWHLSETKTPKSRRTIPIPPSMLFQLRRHKRLQAERRMKLGGAYLNHDLVFATAEGGPLNIQNFTRRHFKTTLKRAELPKDFTLYSLRHTCATQLLAAGENPKVVSERLGHASVKITLDLYCHVLPHMQQAASDRIEKMFFKKVGTQ
jgi:integrase